MPITQERMLRLIEVGEQAIALADALTAVAKTLTMEDIRDTLGAAIEHTANAPAKASLAALQAKLIYIFDTLASGEIPPALYRALADERAHFRAHRAENERAARYMARKRARAQAMQSEGYAFQPPQAPQAPQTQSEGYTYQSPPAAQVPARSEGYTSPPPPAAQVAPQSSVTYAPDFTAPPDVSATPTPPGVLFPPAGPIPLSDELVAKLMAESEGYQPTAVASGRKD